MKKILLSLATVALFGGHAIAQNSCEITWAYQGYENGEAIGVWDDDDVVTIKFDKGTNSNEPKYYNGGSAVRFYGGNTMEVSVASGYQLRDISFELGDGYAFNGPTLSIGRYEPVTSMWYPDAAGVTSVTFTQDGTSGQARIEAMTIYYEPLAGDVVTAPTVTMMASTYGYQVVMYGDEGANIYYTTNGDDPTTASEKYTAPVEVWEKTTFKAIAEVDGRTSGVTTFVADPPTVVDDFLALYGFVDDVPSEGVKVEVRGGSYVNTYLNGSYMYLYDASCQSYMLLYGTPDAEYAVGTQFSSIIGTFKNYNGLPEITNYKLQENGTSTVPKPVESEGVSLVAANMVNQYMKLINVNITQDGNNYTITDQDGETVAIYNRFNLDIPVMNAADVTGFVAIYKDAVQFYPTEITNTENGVAAIASDEAPAEYYNLQGIRVANPENGLYIIRQGNKVSKAVVK